MGLVVVFLDCISLDARLFCLGLFFGLWVIWVWICVFFGCLYCCFELRLFVCIGLIVFI